MTMPRRQQYSISPSEKKRRLLQNLLPHRKSPASFTSRPPPCSKAEHSNFRPSASVCGKSPPPPISIQLRHLSGIFPGQGRYPRFPEEIPVLLRHRPQLSHDLRRAPPSPRHFRKRHPPRPGHHRLRQLPPPHHHHNLILQGCTKNLHTRYTLKK